MRAKNQNVPLLPPEVRFTPWIAPDFPVRRGVKFKPMLLNLTAHNGGSDLDNGEHAGSQGDPVADDKEEDPGAYVLVNWDDDDADGEMNDDGSWKSFPVPDLLDDHASVKNEDNLAKFLPSMSPLLEDGVVELEIVQGADKVKAWKKCTKEELYDLPNNKKTWNLTNAKERADLVKLSQDGLWIEALSKSDSQRDICLVLRYKGKGQEFIGDRVRLTSVMINLGDGVHREAQAGEPSWGHAGLLVSFAGPCTLAALKHPASFEVMHMQPAGLGGELRRELLTDFADNWWGAYTSELMTQEGVALYKARLQVMKAAAKLYDRRGEIGFTDLPYIRALQPVPWDGKLTSITGMRCDGFVEAAYEANGIPVWGALDSSIWQWDIRLYTAEHKYPGLTPAKQCGHNTDGQGTIWNTAFRRQTICEPDIGGPLP